ncbi:DUF3576 domain-containing protein [Candidatus Pelagibacter sp.]|nr:DUF3576 domain-containing protein [Candidatus Pelagibacter sp.]
MKKLTCFSILLLLFLSNCGIYKRSDVKDNPVNVNERVARNIKEGKGIRFGNLGKSGSGGTFDFASSNSMWRASLEILDFVTFANASYSGGIIITDWFNDNSDNNNSRDLKITIKFLSNEIRADGLQIDIHERICSKTDLNSCKINKISSVISSELKVAILKKAARIENNITTKRVKEFDRDLTVNKDN